MPTYTTSGLGSLEISRLLVEAISAASTQGNQMPLLYSPGAPIVRGSDVTTFIQPYESPAAFTSTDPSGSNAVMVFPYYYVDGSDVRDKVVMMYGHVERDWAVLRTEMLDPFRLADSRSRDVIYTRRCVEDFCTHFGGGDNSGNPEIFLSHI